MFVGNLRRAWFPDATDFFALGGYTGAIPGEVVAPVIYGDLVVLLNFLVDFLLLLGTNRLAGFPPCAARSAGAALFGSAYAAGCLVPGFAFLGNRLWRLVSLAAMGLLAFGWNAGALKRSGVFLVLSMALGGMALALGSGSFLRLTLTAAGLWLLCRVAFGGNVGGRTYVPVTIRQGGRAVALTALVDTGNTLRDPLTGESVLVIGPDPAGTLTGLTRDQLRAPLDTLARRPIPGLRLVPYRAVGTEGFLLARRFPEVTIRGRTRQTLVAFAPEGLGENSLFQALTGGNL